MNIIIESGYFALIAGSNTVYYTTSTWDVDLVGNKIYVRNGYGRCYKLIDSLAQVGTIMVSGAPIAKPLTMSGLLDILSLSYLPFTTFAPGDLAGSSDAGCYYFDETLRDFDGATYVDTGIYNTFARKNYWHVWLKINLDDGQPAAFEVMWGARGSAASDVAAFLLLTDGRLRITVNTGYTTTNPVLGDGATGYKVFHIHGDNVGNTLKLYVDGALEETFGISKPDLQVLQAIAYGCQNREGVYQNYTNGDGKAVFFWGADAADLSVQNISDMDTWMTNK